MNTKDTVQILLNMFGDNIDDDVRGKVKEVLDNASSITDVFTGMMKGNDEVPERKEELKRLFGLDNSVCKKCSRKYPDQDHTRVFCLTCGTPFSKKTVTHYTCSQCKTYHATLNCETDKYCSSCGTKFAF